MPFASPEAPSIALTQLKSVLEERFGDAVTVEILYLDLDFITYAGGLANYLRMSSGLGRLAGASDWFFRQVAFPEAPDNTQEYLDRFYFDDEDEESRLAKEFILEKRPGLGDEFDRLIDTYRLDEADVVGFTAMFYQTVASFAMARRIKDRNPELVTVIGGAACEAEMGVEIAKQVRQIDYVFSGPALVSFPRFIECRIAGDARSCERIRGVFSAANVAGIEGGGCALTGEERNINEVVSLDYGGFLDRFEATFPDRELRAMLMFETSRGCSWGEKIACTFCGLNGTAMNYRSMTPENARDQMRSLFDYLPRCNFFLAVDTIVPDDYLEEVFPKLGTPKNAAMMYEVRPLLSEEQIATLCDAGVLVIQPGIEALSTPTLKLMRKGTTAFGNLRFLKTCSKYPMRVEWNLLIGSPGEDESTWETYLENLPLLAHLHPPTGSFPISFDRFSQYFLNTEEHGLDLQPQEFYEYAYPFDSEALAKVAYHFVDRNADREKIDDWAERLNAAVGQWWSGWQREARLYMSQSNGDRAIYDSRSGSVIEYAVSEVTSDVLRYLETPHRFEHLAAEFGEKVAEREVGYLRERRLLFEENGRMMSLVIF